MEDAGGTPEAGALQKARYRRQPPGAQERSELVRGHEEAQQVDEGQAALEGEAGEPVAADVELHASGLSGPAPAMQACDRAEGQ